MQLTSIIVKVEFDEEAGVYVASSGDISGLALEAASFEELKPKVLGAIEDLIEMNGIDSGLTEIPVHFAMSQLEMVPNPNAA